MIRSAFLSIFILLWGGCTTIPSLTERQNTLDSIAANHHLQSNIISTTRFPLYALSDTYECENRQMRVYIEGDGFAWVTRSRLSDDPTPINPVAAKLMGIDPSHCKMYLARPCQYTRAAGCKSDYWDTRRFSSEVVESYGEALRNIKQDFHNTSFLLIGYSGGGAIAALTAAKRKDVTELITVAGNIDTDGWIKYHSLSPLEGSLNPADEFQSLSELPQIHFIGGKDSVIPWEMYENYKRRMKRSVNLKAVICEECTHTQGWIERWPEYLRQLPTQDTQK